MRGTFWLFALLMAARAVVAAHADSFAELKSGELTIQVDARAQANLIYHLDCLARVVTCTNAAYDNLWRGEIGLTTDDEQKLKDWSAVRGEVRKASQSVESTQQVKALVPIPDQGAGKAWLGLLQSEYVASDDAALARAWSAAVPAEKASQLAAVVAQFKPRFDTWWATHESELTAFVPGIEAAMRKGRAGELLSAAARFYRSDLGDRRVYVHLFLQPKLRRPHSNAYRNGAHMAVEVTLGEKPEERVDVIVHELAHHLFGVMPPERKAALADALIRQGIAGVPAWNLFDEVQATSIGNILVARNVSAPERFKKLWDTPQSFYADEMIDLGARATFELFERALAKRARITDDFAVEFVAALRAKMGARLETPVLQLRGMIVNIEDAKLPWPGKLRNVVNAWSMWTFDPLGGSDLAERLDKFPGLSAVIFATPEQVTKLEPAAKVLGVGAEALTAALGSSRGMLFVAQRTPYAFSFVFVAREDAVMDALIVALPACRLATGVCVRIE